MKLFTSYFAMVPEIEKQFKDSNLFLVNIAVGKPKWLQGKLIDFKFLFPDFDLVRDYKEEIITKEEYEKIYTKDVLDKLDFNMIMNRINLLFKPEEENRVVVFLCYEKYFEKSREQIFCHRHLFSKWFNKRLDLIKEYQKS